MSEQTPEQNAERNSATDRVTGVFYHDGEGPYPWAAERTLIG